MPKRSHAPSNEALFEDDYLLRTLGRVAYDPETALAELVANAWDAGAGWVNVIIPDERGGLLTVEDDGHGMSREQFRARWMKLGYNRSKAQGPKVEFPPERSDWSRQAFGRNGIGRHGLLCFSDEYTVETVRKSKLSRFVIGTQNHSTSPFYIREESEELGQGHGTRLIVVVDRNLPSSDAVRHVLAARFLHDPRFIVEVNGVSVPLSEHQGLIETQTLEIAPGFNVTAHVVDANSPGQSARYQGIAFWVNRRLVGLPSWSVGPVAVIDGRSRFAKRHAIVVECSGDWMREIEGDWSRFKKSDLVSKLFSEVASYAIGVFERLSEGLIEEQSEDALMRNRERFRNLPTGARLEVARFTQELVHEQPGIQGESLNQAVRAAIKIYEARSGASLLAKLEKLGDKDLEGLDRLLEQWTVQDALTVLDEIDRRLSVIAAIEKLEGDPEVDELHTLHPLVTQARWLFGPEFDSNEYASNKTLRSVATRVFKSKVEDLSFPHPKQRPDIVILKDSTLCLVGTDSFGSAEDQLCTVRDILLIELKKGHSTIGKTEMSQAESYAEDLLADGGLSGMPTIHVFVVGHMVERGRLSKELKDADNRTRGYITPVTYARLTDTANKRLHGLKERIPAKYEEDSGFALAQKIMGMPSQAPLL